MPTKSRKPVLRPDARVVEIYNDGLCVYLYDETRSDEIEQLIASGEFGKTDANESFHANLSISKFGKHVAKNGLALCYELRQDDEISIEVAVGEKLTEDELEVACWLEPQTGYLNLTGGKLCIESPNSIRFEYEESGDAGATLEVPPGHYRVTLYRVDWDETERVGKKYKGPDEFILLTPIEAPKKALSKSPILPFVPRVLPDSWKGAYAINGNEFSAQVCCSFWWEPLKCNLEPEAIAQLGLEPGSVFELTASGITMRVVYFGDIPYPEIFLKNREKIAELAKGHEEFAIAHWDMWWLDYKVPGPNFFTIRRIEGKKPYPRKAHDVWVEATGRVLPEREKLD